MKSFKFVLKKLFFFIPTPLLGAAEFESKAYFLNKLSKPLAVNISKKNYINLGCGPKIVEKFINVDFFGTPNIDYAADLRKPLKISTSIINGIFCEHTLEHLTYIEVNRLLGECLRILMVDGVIRIILPDLSIFIKNYNNGNAEWFKRWESLMFTFSPDLVRRQRSLNTPMHAISFVTQEFGHVSAWDFETLEFYLQKNGFRDIRRVEYMEGVDKMLLIDHEGDDRKLVSLYVEARK
jgi:hypothetical protein